MTEHLEHPLASKNYAKQCVCLIFFHLVTAGLWLFMEFVDNYKFRQTYVLRLK